TYSVPLEKLSKQFNVRFYEDNELNLVPKADFYFQLFFGGRNIKTYDSNTRSSFENLIFCTDKTVTFISDTMHGTTLDEVIGPDFRFYFQPPGIGPSRSGILDSTDLDEVKSLTTKEQIKFAASLFSQPEFKNLILGKEIYQVIKRSFVYGVHNETFDVSLIGQTEDFLKALEEYSSGSAVFVFTPQKIEKLKEVLPKFGRLLTVGDLKTLKKIEKKLYLLQLPPLTNLQFTALLAIADIPVLLEGNNAISQAIRLHKDFLVMRSLWNAPQIKDLISIDSDLGGPWIYPGVYNLDQLSKPYFSSYFHRYISTTWQQRFFERYALSAQIPDFVDKLYEVIKLSELLEDPTLPRANLADVIDRIKDPYLKYSLSLAALQNHEISSNQLKKIQQQLSDNSRKNAPTGYPKPDYSHI
ncbi:MAG: hypothetical protein JKY15_07935, partial [Deltaproteobacteria bacterium]|nr:hypothetical protein [Deltaproteobacteria bacterium]